MVSQSGSAPSGGSDRPGNDGQTETLGVGVGSFGGVGVGGMQGTLGVTGGEIEGHGVGGRVGVVSFGGVGVGRQVGSGSFGSAGRAGAAAACGGGRATPGWDPAFFLGWAQGGGKT